MDIDPKLLDFCTTDKERQALEAIIEHGECRLADDALGYARSYSSAKLKQVKRKAAKAGYAPEASNMDGSAPVGFTVKRHSARFDKEGRAAGGWLISEPTKGQAWAALQEALEAMKGDITPCLPIPAPAQSNDDLCNLYTYSDFHLGMLAQEEEGGANWDIKIAEKTLIGSFGMMLEQSPPATRAVVNIQGDMLHSDGLLPVTPAHRHVLDQDGRFSRIVATAIRTIRALVAMALAKHDSVHLVICEGNHDEASSVWLRLLFAALYENEPRVEVNDSELPFYVFEWGEVMLGFHHGHKVKNEQLPLLFAAQFPEEWGRTKKRTVHCGHRHHVDEKEYNGVTVVQHPTIAARDAYAARGGWIADRAVQSITYSKKFGQVGRVFVSPEMLQAA